MSDNVMFAVVPYVVMVAFLLSSVFRIAAAMPTEAMLLKAGAASEKDRESIRKPTAPGKR